jgi:hypothetical protein
LVCSVAPSLELTTGSIVDYSRVRSRSVGATVVLVALTNYFSWFVDR